MATLEQYALMSAAAYDERRLEGDPNRRALDCAA